MSVTESAAGQGETFHSAQLVPVQQDGSFVASGEINLDFGAKDPAYKAGKIYLVHIEPS